MPADGRGLRRRGLPGPRRSGRVVRVARLHDGRPARRERPREPRPRAERDPQFRLRVSRRTGSPSTWRRPTCARRARRSTCRSRSASSRRRASSSGAHIADLVLLGELSLDGSIHPARGVLPIAAAARRDGRRGHPAAGAERQRGGGRRPASTSCRSSSLAEAVRALNDPVDARARRRRRRRSRAARRRGRSRRRPRPAARAARARDRVAPAATTCCSSARPAPARR